MKRSTLDGATVVIVQVASSISGTAEASLPDPHAARREGSRRGANAT